MDNKLRNLLAGIGLLSIGPALTWVFVPPALRSAHATGIRYAVPAAQGNGDCSSWANACTLQTALTGASSGDEIWVAAGIYYPGTVRTDTFALPDGVTLYGGFAGTESDRQERDWQQHLSILSGDIDQNDITDPTGVVTTTDRIVGDNAYHVVNGSLRNAGVDGFIITAGRANGTEGPENMGGGAINVDDIGMGYTQAFTNVIFSGNFASLDGGGLYNYRTDLSLTNVTFSGNTASSAGGGMFTQYNSRPTLTDVTFTGNAANIGGGMYSANSSATLTDVTFSGNTAREGGGVFNTTFSSPTFVNVIFSGNKASVQGGGMFNDNQSSPQLTHAVFANNVATSSGGGMRNRWYCNPHLTNVTFFGNAAAAGGGIYNSVNSDPTLENAILWGDTADEIYNTDTDNTPLITFSDIQGCGGSGAWNSVCGTDGGGNIDADPFFVGPANHNLRLLLTSPAIDAGDNAALPPDILTDLAGNPRFADIPTVPDTGSGAAPIVDLGAYEAQHMHVDVALSKGVLPPTAAPGEAITFTLTLANAGNLPATGIAVTDTMPAPLWGLAFTSTLTVTDTGHISPYVWLVRDLAPGQGGLITVSGVLTVPLAAGTYTNTAVIGAEGDAQAENNTAVTTFIVPNVAPAFISAPLTTTVQGAPYAYTATAGDKNGDALTIAATLLPAWLTLDDHGDGTATLAGTPASVGDYQVVLRVTDQLGAFVEQSFTITVAEGPHYYLFLPLVLRGTP